jgi:FKBP-type peptidyl-prolyl cis-trans isomerase 2
MTLKKGDFVELEYTGRLKETGEVFDTTDEKLAKEKDLHSPEGFYGPLVVRLGESQVLKGLDEALVGKDLGKHVIQLPAGQAFGHKDPKLVHLMPLKRFHEHQINPVPGLRMNIDGLIGLVRSTSGGRVMVDFNHPLAGKDVTYEVNVKRRVDEPVERVKAMLRFARIEAKHVEAKDGKVHVGFPKAPPKQAAESLAKKLSTLTGATVTIASEDHPEDKKAESAAKTKA